MSGKKEKHESFFLAYKTDEELIILAQTLQEATSQDSFNTSDLILLDAVFDHLEKRRYLVTIKEILIIEKLGGWSSLEPAAPDELNPPATIYDEVIP